MLSPGAEDSIEKVKIEKLCAKSLPVKKIEIRKAIQEIYKVKVIKINTLILPGKLRRVRYQLGRTPDYKKAVVTLAEGQKIEVG